MADGHLGADHGFTDLGKVSTDRQRTNPVILVALVLVLGVVGFGAYEFFVEDKNPIDAVMTWIQQLMGSDEEAQPDQQPVERQAPPQPVAKPTPKKPDGHHLKAVAGNPYWALPNAILGAQAPLGRLWSPDEEEAFKAGLSHKYAYQRWKTVMSIRAKRLKGSDAALWDAMQDNKFWIRMQAAMGLAEMGVEVSRQSLEGALAKARSELIANFFERFVKRPKAGQLFIMRQVVRVLDERGRLVVLRAITRSKDALRDLYMTAATQDPGPRVQKWVKQALSERPVQPDRYNQLLTVVRGEAGDVGLDAIIKKAKIRSKHSQDDEDSLKTEEDMSDDEAGGVAFYDTDESTDQQPASAPQTDPASLDYTPDESP